MRPVFAILAMLFTGIFTGTSHAQSLNGYCLDLVEAGCMPRFIPFHNMSIDFCEESCKLTNPVGVRGMDAALFDLKCLADSPTPMDGNRVMILRQRTHNGRLTTSWIKRDETLEIVPCP